MTLIDSRRERTSMLCAMYMAQGIPWGFMVVAVVAYLSERGATVTETSGLIAIVMVPWTFKLIWAPVIDSVTIRSMGRRRPWIIAAQLMMAVSLLGLIWMGDLSKDLRLLTWMFFIHNCFASLQDVCTDALAVDVLPPDEQGVTNGAMWGAKLIGKAIGAGVMAEAIARWGINSAVILQFGCLLVIMLFPLLMLERPGEKRFPWSRGVGPLPTADTSNYRSPILVIKELCRAFSTVPTFVFLIFGTINVIGWGVVEVLTTTLYTKELNWDFVELSRMKGIAVFPEMAGALLGGLIADRIGPRFAILLGLGVYGLLAIAFGFLPVMWDENWFAGGYLLLNPAALAIGSVGYLSMSMRISWTTAAATVFTVFMTVNNIAHVAGNLSTGVLREYLLLPNTWTFVVAGVAMWLPLLLLPLVNPNTIDELKHVKIVK